MKRKAKRKVENKGLPEKEKHSRRPGNRLLWISFLLLFLAVSCGDGKGPAPAPSKGASPSAKKKAEPAKTEGQKEAIKEVEYTYNPAGKPDPFKSFLQLTSAQSRSVPLTPLQKYEFSQLKLVAILLMPEGNVGLVEDATGKGYFVKKGTLIGKNDGKIVKILEDRLVVEEVFLDVLGQKKINETSLTLHKSEEGGEK